MSYVPPADSRQRLLRASLDPQQEAESLETAIKSKELSQLKVELAARLQYRPAAIALELELQSFDSLHSFFEAFHRFSKEAWLRMTVAAMRSVLPIWERACPDNDSPTKTVVSAERWILHPSENTRHESGRLQAMSKSTFLTSSTKGTPLFVAKTATFIGQAIASQADNGCFNYCFQAIKRAAGCLAHPDDEKDNAVFEARTPSQATIERVISIMRAEVAPWALGYGDPVLERLTA